MIQVRLLQCFILAVLLLSAIKCSGNERVGFMGKTDFPDSLIFTVPVSNDERVNHLFELVYGELGKRLGFTVELKPLPAIRARKDVEDGKADGEAGRVYYYSRYYPYLIRVEEPIVSITFCAFAIKPDISLTGWESLKNSGYKVEYRRGTELPKQMTGKFLEPTRVSQVNSASQGLKKLVAGRTDIYIDVDLLVRPLLRTEEYKKASVYQAGIMEQVTLHLYLAKKHKHLADRVSGEFRTMKSEGLIQVFFKQVYVE